MFEGLLPKINNFDPSALKCKSVGAVSKFVSNIFIEKGPEVVIVDDKSNGVDNVYWLISSFWLPITNKLVPVLLKAIPVGVDSWALISKVLNKVPVLIS